MFRRVLPGGGRAKCSVHHRTRPDIRGRPGSGEDHPPLCDRRVHQGVVYAGRAAMRRRDQQQWDPGSGRGWPGGQTVRVPTVLLRWRHCTSRDCPAEVASLYEYRLSC